MARSVKAKRKDVSLHSRAARRAVEPSAEVAAIDAAPDDKDSREKALEATLRRDYAGVMKKSSKRMSRQQRLRKEKIIERQEQNEDKLLKKVAGSRERAKRVKGRNANWDDLNSAIVKLVPAPQRMKEDTKAEDSNAASVAELQQKSSSAPRSTFESDILDEHNGAERSPVEEDEIL